MCRFFIVFAAVSLLYGLLYADVIELNNGGIVVGKVVERTDDYIVVVTKGGVRTVLDREKIKSIERGEPEEVYRRKLKEIEEESADEHYALGVWCERVKLKELAREEFEKCLILEPNHTEARKKLGFKFTREGWVRKESSPDEEPKTGSGLTEEKADLVESLLRGELKLSEMEEQKRKEAVETLKEALEIEKANLARIRKQVLLRTGFTGNGLLQAMLERWHKRWEEARLQALKKLFIREGADSISVTVERTLEIYKYYAILINKRLRPIRRISQKQAERLLKQMCDVKERMANILSLLGGGEKGLTDVVSGEPDSKSAYAFLSYIAGRREDGWKCASELSDWRLALFLTLVSERILKRNEKLAKVLNDEERLLSRLINGYRMALGKMPLELDERLCKAAKGHLVEMERLGYFGHISPLRGRSTPKDRALLLDYRAELIGENLYRGRKVTEALDAWRRSPPHHRHLLSGWDSALLKDNEKLLALVFMPWRSFGVACSRSVAVMFGPLSSVDGGVPALDEKVFLKECGRRKPPKKR